MKIRTELREHETLAYELKPFEQLFLGDFFGVLLRPRGVGDPHICFELISEDDEYWSPYTGNGSDSHYFDDAIAVLAAAKAWCEQNAAPDMYGRGKQKRQSGWIFRGKDRYV